jgi:hypothetical protein
MNTQTLKSELRNTEVEMEKAIQSAIERFVKKTGLPIEEIFVFLGEPSEMNGVKYHSVDKVTCEVNFPET